MGKISHTISQKIPIFSRLGKEEERTGARTGEAMETGDTKTAVDPERREAAKDEEKAEANALRAKEAAAKEELPGPSKEPFPLAPSLAARAKAAAKPAAAASAVVPPTTGRIIAPCPRAREKARAAKASTSTTGPITPSTRTPARQKPIATKLSAAGTPTSE